MKDRVESPIFVTGIERSGASIIGRIIQSCGAFTGKTTSMFESIKIKDIVDLYYTGTLNIDERGQSTLPDIKHLLIQSDWKEKVLNQLIKEGYTSNKAWMYKSSRIAQIFPVWQYAFPNAKYIIVRRKTSDIIQSCLKTGFMDAYDTQEGWLGWIHEQEHLFVSMIEVGLNCKQIWPERMVYGDYSQVYEMLEWLGLEWNDNIVSLVTPLLKNSLQKERGK